MENITADGRSCMLHAAERGICTLVVRDYTEKRWVNEMKRWTIIIVFCLALVGTAVFVDSLDDVYRSSESDVTVMMPSELSSDESDKVTVIAQDLDGEPLEGELVLVEIITETGIEKYAGKTDGDGIANVDFIPPIGNATIVVNVDGRSFTGTLSVVESRSVSIIIQTDKPIYQPGQTVHMRFLTFERSTRTPSTDAVEIDIFSPEGDKVFKGTLDVNAYGISALDFTLSDLMPLGEYTVRATVGDEFEEASLKVDRYVLPKFIIAADGLKAWYVPGDNITFDLTIDYSFGQPVEGEIEVEIIGHDDHYGSTSLNTLESDSLSGTFIVDFTPGTNWSGFDQFLFNITVTDTADHTETKTLATSFFQSPLTLAVVGDWNIAGLESTYWLIVTYPDGRPAEASVEANLFEYDSDDWEDPNDDQSRGWWYPRPEVVGSWDLETDSLGMTPITFTVPEHRGYIEVNVTDGDTTAQYVLDLDGVKDGIKIVPGMYSYDVGEIATFSVVSSGGLSTKGYYDVFTSGTRVRSGTFDLSEGSGSFSFTTTPQMAPGIEVRALRIADDLSSATSSALVAVIDPDALTVSATPSSSTVKPGDDLSVDISVDRHDLPVQAALGIRIIDTSVFELAQRMTASDLYEDEEVYQVFRYMDGEESAPGIDGYVPTGGEEQVQIGAYIHDTNEALDFQAEGMAPAILSIGLVLVIAFMYLVSKARTASAYAMLAVALVALPPAAIMTQTITPTSEDSIGSYMSAPSSSADEDSGELLEKEDGGWRGGWDEWDFIADGGVPENALGAGNGSQAGSGDDYSSAGGKSVTHVRKYFPETWYWNPMIETDENGMASIDLTAPDTITTWSMETVASTMEGWIGTDDIEITVFQDFFVEPDVPVRALLGDEFELKALVYNYLDEQSTIALDISAEGMTIVGATDGTVVVDANSVDSISFRLVADEVGEASVRLDATNGILSDSVIRKIRVEPTGLRIDNVTNGILEDDMTVETTIEMDPLRVPGSEMAYIKLQGSMNAVAMDGAEEYIHYVSGCGEQSMSTLAMDVIAYRLLDDSIGDDKKREYEEIVVQGILHELTFLMENPDGPGRGIVWFPSDRAPHPWLTSWGLITFQDAIDSGFAVDHKVITDMQALILELQHSDGSFTFPEWGFYEYTPDVLKTKTVATTAYVARSLIYSGYDGTALDDAVAYIGSHLSEIWDDPYSLALSLIVLEERGHSQTTPIADRLKELAIVDGDETYWTTDNTMIDSGSDDRYYWRWSSTPQVVETTGYCVMALNDLRPFYATAGTRYLLNHRTTTGFFGTRDTVVAFQAIARQAILDVEEMAVSVSIDGTLVHEETITEENAEVTRYIDLRPYVDDEFDVTIGSASIGQIAFQLISSYYMPYEPVILPIDIDLIMSDVNVSTGDIVNGTVSITYNGTDPLQMILIEMPTPAGFEQMTWDLDTMIEEGDIDNWEDDDGTVLVYITPIGPGSEIEIPYTIRADLEATSTIASMVVYDMYQPGLRAESPEITITSA